MLKSNKEGKRNESFPSDLPGLDANSSAIRREIRSRKKGGLSEILFKPRELSSENRQERESENIVKDGDRRAMWKKFWAGASHFRTGRRRNARLIR